MNGYSCPFQRVDSDRVNFFRQICPISKVGRSSYKRPVNGLVTFFTKDLKSHETRYATVHSCDSSQYDSNITMRSQKPLYIRARTTPFGTEMPSRFVHNSLNYLDPDRNIDLFCPRQLELPVSYRSPHRNTITVCPKHLYKANRYRHPKGARGVPERKAKHRTLRAI